MPDQKGVTETSPTPTETAESVTEDVNQSADTSTAEPEVEQGQTQQPVQQAMDSVDEQGVPWKNRAQEWKRKTEELSSNLPSMIEQKLSEVLSRQNQPQQREYTIAELEQIAINDPQYRPWVEEQKENVRLKKLTTQIDEKFRSTEKVRQDEQRRQNALQTVMTEFPELFLKDGMGRPAGWDNSNPMLTEVSKLMQDQRLSNDPEGLLWAVHIANSRLAKKALPKVAQEIQKVKQKAKKLENQQMVSGGGRQAESVKDSLKKAQERLAQTGSMRDAQEAMTEYFKKKGII